MIRSAQKLIRYDIRKVCQFARRTVRHCSSDSSNPSNDEFMKRIQDLPDSEKFGDYSKRFSVWNNNVDIQEKMSNLDPDDIEDEESIADIENFVRKSSTDAPHDLEYFDRKINRLISSGDYAGAKVVFYSEMLEKFRVRPSSYTCNRILYTHAALGEATEARNLLKLMLSHRLQPNAYTFGMVFTAYAHCNDRNFASKAGEKLFNYIKRIDFVINEELYSRIIKAFSVDGHARMMMTALDDMLINGKMRPTERILTYLLRGCSKDKEIGAGLALQIFHRFRNFKDIYIGTRHCVLLLNCICSGKLGDGNQLVNLFCKDREDVDDAYLLPSDEKVSANDLEKSITTEEFANDHIYKSPVNLLSDTPFTMSAHELQQFISKLGELNFKRNISLLGGVEGFLELVKSYGADVNEYVVTTLLNHFGSDVRIRKRLLDLVEELGLQKDLRFYNTLISTTSNMAEKTAIMKEMKNQDIVPDVVSYAALGKNASSTPESIKAYLELLKSEDKSPNLVIFKQMFCRPGTGYSAKKYILELMKEHDIHPDKELINMIEMGIHDTRQVWLKRESENLAKALSLRHQRIPFVRFVSYYTKWLKWMPLQSSS